MDRKKALVTGASRGIGKAIAIELAKNGYDIYAVCRHSLPALQELCSGWQEVYGVRAVPVLTDIGDVKSVDRLFGQMGDVDVVVNNAGVSYIGLMTDMPVEEWHRVMNTNLNSLFYVCRRAVPFMVRKRKGKIINISSVWGSAGASMEVAYSASKGGMNAFTKALAKELAPSNIQVNAIACGVIETEMNRHLNEEERAALREEIPADRFGQTAEVASLVMQLIQGGEYLTGQVITLDGGWT